MNSLKKIILSVFLNLHSSTMYFVWSFLVNIFFLTFDIKGVPSQQEALTVQG